MEQRGTPVTPLAALDDLREVVRQPGPFLTVYLPLPPATAETAQAVALGWRACRDEAEAAGAPQGVLDAVEAAIDDVPRAAAGVVVVAVEDRPPHVEHLSRPPADLVRWQGAPALVPLIRSRDADQVQVVALVDRQGADLAVRGDSGGAGARGVIVDGPADDVRKVAAGGWSQRRFQQRAEEAWHENMAEVAERLVRLVERHAPRFVVVGGDERAVGLLVDRLPTAVQRIVRPIEVTRADDGSAARLDDELDRVLDEWLGERIDETIAAYARELGQHDRAAAGLDATRAALGSGRVATLLVTTPARHDADDVVAIALRTGADVQAVDPGGLPGDVEVGALLRW